MVDIALSPEIRDNGLASVGESIYVGVSPDLYDGLSDDEWKVMKDAAPKFFDSWVGRHVGLPEGFETHYRNDVLPDMEVIRQHPELRDGFRRELGALLSDERRIRALYTPGGETYSDLLRKWADKARNQEPIQTGMFRKSGQNGTGKKRSERKR